MESNGLAHSLILADYMQFIQLHGLKMSRLLRLRLSKGEGGLYLLFSFRQRIKALPANICLSI